nr:hemolysin family protein [Candidatus Gracilibacteria bacterium]
MDPVYFFTFIILLLLSGFFSSTELAILSIPNHKVETLFREGRFGAKSLKFLKHNSDRFLITGLIGNNLVNTTIAALATQLSINFAETSGIEQSLAVGIATGIITFVLLMFGEIIPKSFAVKNATFLALTTSNIYKFLLFILFPLVICIEFIVKLFTGKTKSHIITNEELETFIDMGKDSGTLEEGEHQKIKNILEFGDTTVEEVMTPRVNIRALDEDTTVKDAIAFYKENSYSRILIYSGTIDKIDYFFTIRDLLNAKDAGLINEQLKNLDNLKQVIKVPLNQPLDTVLKIFQKSYKHMAVVMDEYGGVAGIVTLEDIIEEILGEIRDETDRGETDEIKKIGNNSYVIDPSIIIDDILEEFNLTFESIGLHERELSGETVSYIITHKLERFPKPDEIISFHIKCKRDGEKTICEGKTLEFRVIGINDGKIDKVEVNRS